MRYTTLLCGFLAIFLWSIGACIYVHLKDVAIVHLLGIPQLLGGLVACLYFGQRLHPSTFTHHIRSRWHLLLLIGLNSFFYVLAFRHAPPVHADLINYLWPAMIVVGNGYMKKHILNLRNLSGLAVGFLGVFTLLSRDIVTFGWKQDYLLGYMAALFAALSWTAYTLGNQVRNVSFSPLDLVIVGASITLADLFIPDTSAVTHAQWALIGFTGVCIYGTAYPLWQIGLSGENYQVLGSACYCIPILSVTWLVVCGFAQPSWELALAIILVFSACLITPKTVVTEKDFRTN